jgi:hypothetical protein
LRVKIVACDGGVHGAAQSPSKQLRGQAFQP